ncbi:glycogen debranching enzyme N-terminal domain-containing protein [Flavobacteriaceae bacterium F89]|uniref:Glycogen debranching enzyme N-terminal domain-containing protein n=1 Tax=Cerina litoralis TaxID=2874477 RepID=A0AAE3JRE0_9FLAO|nr:amylo-alpha-1,6-glucosidase [Cerina litoralis]MCG2461233.1 glycogen debranching enzyme N-terminal domain-containing protein [Cerina litoralis]
MNSLFSKEWLLTNGLGGYASSTRDGANTRRYHGLLVAAYEAPVNRKVLVAKVEERVRHNDTYFDLSTNKYPGTIHPRGNQYIQNFKIDPFPTWCYGTASWQLQKQIFMVQGSNTTCLVYTNLGDDGLPLEIHPLYAFADFHTNFHENGITDFYTEIDGDRLKTYPKYGSDPIYTGWNQGDFIEARSWYKNVLLPRDRERGLDFCCDYYRIGYIKSELGPKERLTLYFTLDGDIGNKNIKDLLSKEKRRSKVPKPLESTSDFYGDLLQAGRQFLVHRNSTDSMSIIAGYHWFADWGRDTLIAMRGLTISTGNQKASKSILSTFLNSLNQGMLPNKFPDRNGDPIKYNTMDAALWLFVALYEYYKKFGDTAFIKGHIKSLQTILDFHSKGSRYNIRVTPEGFLYGGEDGVQLTWMDAIVNGRVITPRVGCPVEINALWYNAIKIYDYFCTVLRLKVDEAYAEVIVRFESNFTKHFTNPQGTLYDVVVPNVSKDNSFRPNQIYVLSLPFVALDKALQKRIFEGVRSKLYTPFGLRTLAMEDSRFQGAYTGGREQRDNAYHQGTVWPFLLYEYYRVFFQLYGTSKANKKKVVDELAPLRKHFYSDEGLHCISEIFDGADPQQGKGTIHQAWSVSALIKLYADYELFEV